MKKKFTIIFAFVLATGVLVQNTQAAVRYVTTAGAGSNDGTSWDNAYIGLQAALSAAVYGDEIWVAAGTYYPSAEVGGTGTRYQTFQMIDGVAIYGGFAGDETATDQRTNYARGETNETILSGDLGYTGSTNDNSYHVFYHPDGLALTSTAILDGFTIYRGNANGSSAVQYKKGGGMYNGNSSSPTINNCTFLSNLASISGGGMANVGADINTVTSPTVTNCTFVLNSAVGAYGGGGGMYNAYSSPSVTNCLFNSNSGQTQNNCSGGGMFNFYSSPTLNNCTFSKNNQIHLGGAISNNRSSPTINNCIIWGNAAVLSGNEFYVVGNSSAYTTTLNNSCYRTGTDAFGVEAVFIGSPAQFVANNCTTADPQFVDATLNDFRIYSVSPCADAGNDAYNSETYDIRGVGFGRKLQKTDAGTAGTIDMGAYEYNSLTDPANPTLTWTGNTDTDWNIPANWDSGSVPTAADDAVIANSGTHPVIASGVGASCNNLTVNSGASLTIKSGGSLITNGTITNNGTVSVEKTITDGSWHLISSPISNATSNNFAGEYLQSWSESTANWSEITETNVSLTPGKGFGFWGVAKTSSTYTLTGTPNTGDIPVGISYTPVVDSANDGANLLGNPYPSCIDWNQVIGFGAVYYYDGTQYLAYPATGGYGLGSQYIAPLQGFFIVIPDNDPSTFTFTNSMRTHAGATSYYKSEQLLSNGLILKTISGSFTDLLLIRFNQEAAEPFDLDRDAYKFPSGIASKSEIWAICSDANLSIDVRPETELIQLGFQNNQNGYYSIELQEIDGIAEATLEDTKLNLFHNLANGAYNFDWQTNDSEERFILHLKATGTNDLEAQAVQVYGANSQIYVSQSGVNYNEMRVYDLSGRLVYQNQLNSSSLQSFSPRLISGVYLVELNGENGAESFKIVL